MEIATAPSPPAPTPWGRVALLAVVCAPVLLLVLLPIGLGLDRYVITGSSMEGDRSGSLSRGSVAYERVVPVSDLRVGDVVTFPRPGTGGDDGDGGDGDGDLVTHRIVAIGPDGLTTQGDANASPDPWTLRPADPTLPRVELAVPWLGWVYLALVGGVGWFLTIGSAAALVALSARSLLRRTPATVGAGPLVPALLPEGVASATKRGEP